MSELKKLGIDSQSFSDMRGGGCLYIDKTDLVYQLTHTYRYVYLSRPKRFGKSLLVDTLACYFAGRRELFAGLALERLEAEWAEHEVVRFDFSGCVNAQKVANMFDATLRLHEKRLRLRPRKEAALSDRFVALLSRIRERTGRGAVVLVDEYDYPLQSTWRKPNEHDDCRTLMRGMFDILKTQDSSILRFVFLTGIARFTHLSLFSSLNNLVDVSLRPEWQALCGITQAELDGPVLRPYVQRMADKKRTSVEDTQRSLKQRYDGYHFYADEEGTVPLDIYNPFTLLRSLEAREYLSEWASNGAQQLLDNFGANIGGDLTRYEHCHVSARSLTSATPDSQQPAIVLFLSGYLTIVGFAEEYYELDFPNQEVREALSDVVVPALLSGNFSVWQARQQGFRTAMIHHDRPAAWDALVAMVADNPHSCIPLQAMQVEERYHYVVRQLMYSIGLFVESERQVEGGRTDLVVWTRRFIYVMEFKRQKYGGSRAAREQMETRHYLRAWQGLGRTVVGWAVGVDDEGKGMLDLEEL